MGRFYKRIICLLLALVMVFGTSAAVFAKETEEQSLEDIIRPQIEAFAKSIDQKNADKSARDIIISHGISGKGKKLSVGKSSALTATIMNSELEKEYLTVLCADLIKSADELKMDEIYSLGVMSWRISGDRYYFYHFYDYNSFESFLNGKYDFPKDYYRYNGNYTYSAGSNSYDESLELIAGGLHADIDIKVKEKNKNNIVYDFSVRFFDRFDFDAENGSTLENLLGFIGLLLFEPFEWESTFDFQIEIPNDCEHSFNDWKTTKNPSCTEKGREERICENCGCAETKSISALGHSFGEWYETKAPTYFEEGEEQRVCSSCGTAESRSIATLEYLLGDVNGDEKINVIDANLVRRYVAKLEELSEKQLAAADTNGDGKVNVLDANLIRKFAAKLIDSFPVKQ